MARKPRGSSGAFRSLRRSLGRGRGLFASLPMLAVMAVTGCSSSHDHSGLPFGGTGPRPADACTMLSSDQVAKIVGTPGPFTGAHEDPDENGKPVWGCTWGTQQSYADLRQLSAKQFRRASTPDSDTVITPLRGIGHDAMLTKNKSDGSDSYLYFRAGGHYYEVQIVVDRRAYGDPANAGREISGAQALAKAVAPRLAG